MASLGHYELLERIGAGGLGEVLKARDTRHGRTVAIKRLPQALAADPARRRALEGDARAAAALSHPHIAALYELGEEDGQPYLAFEFVPGESLDRIIAGRPLNPRRALDLAAQIADALAEAHAAGIVHRDLCPSNVMVTPRGQVKLLDCGLASFTAGGARRQAAALAPPDANHAGPAIPPTLAYLSPEQALGEPADGRSDIFSLGVLLHEMLTGRPPFTGPSVSATLVEILQRTPEPPSRAGADVPVAVDRVVGRALAKALDRRYQSAAEMAADLRAAGLVLEAGSPEPVEEPGVPVEGRSRSRAAMLVPAILVVAAAAWWWIAR